MKPSLSVLTLSLLLFSLTTHLPLSFSQIEQVHDMDGYPVVPSGRYYIVPPRSAPAAVGGGVKLGETGNSACPVTVLQDFSKDDDGLVVTFTIPGISPGIVFTGTPLEIAFERKPRCATSSKWVVIDDDYPQKWVAMGGAQDHPGKKIITGRFIIRKYDAGYKLVFCTTISSCFDIGRRDDQNGRRLILTNGGDPFNVQFLDLPYQ